MATEQQLLPRKLATGLGWFSIGLGLAELTTPDVIAKIIGVDPDGKTRNTLRFYGARELAAGIGILAQSNPAPWLWARVAGDALDISTMAKAATSGDTSRGKAIFALASLAGVTIADIVCAKQLSGQSQTSSDRSGQTSSDISSSIIVRCSAEEVYSFWRNFTRLPEIFDRLESVQDLDNRRSHWRLSLPMGRTLEWDSEVTEDRPNSRIAWRSVSSSAPHTGEVRFEPATGNRGTKVTVRMNWQGLGSGLGKLFGLVPNQHVNIALHNLKQLLELGEVFKSDSSIHRGMYPAQPPEQYQPSGASERAEVHV